MYLYIIIKIMVEILGNYLKIHLKFFFKSMEFFFILYFFYLLLIHNININLYLVL